MLQALRPIGRQRVARGGRMECTRCARPNGGELMGWKKGLDGAKEWTESLEENAPTLIKARCRWIHQRNGPAMA